MNKNETDFKEANASMILALSGHVASKKKIEADNAAAIQRRANASQVLALSRQRADSFIQPTQ